MPKKLKISPNERVDLVDLNRASTGYTEDSDKFHRSNLWLSRNPGILKGFRIEVSDQSASPGEFTIYNGLAIDLDGSLLNNEDQVADARTVTLTGTSTPFYVEVEFTQTESDVDSRAFWDPTYTGNTPPGREFIQNVSTRYSPDWRVSTNSSGFDTTVNTVKIPIAILYTNGSNEISGYTAVNAATVLEEDAGTTDTVLNVVDSTLFPDSGSATVGGTGVTITSNDRTNGLITISAGMGVTKQAGAIVIETGTATFLPLETSAIPVSAGATSSTDLRRIFFKGNEVRGSAFSVNPEDSGTRSDIQVKSLKDYVDFLAAQIRELKFGSLRSDVNSALPPSSFSSTRHYDRAGSVTGAKTVAVTIGDGTNSFGDLNADSDNLGTIIAQAHDSFDSTEGGEVFVKKGTYVWDATVTVDRRLTITFEEGTEFGSGTYAANPLALQTSSLVEVINMPPVPTSALPFPVIPVDGSFQAWDPNFRAVDSYVNLDWSPNGDPGGNKISLHNCTLISSDTDPAVKGDPTVATNFGLIEFRNCTFQYEYVTDSSVALISGLNLSNAIFVDCTFDLTASTGSAANFIDTTGGDNLVIERCSFLSGSGGLCTGGIDIGGGGTGAGPVLVRDCTFNFYFSSSTSTTRERTVLYLDMPDATVEGCDFSAMHDRIVSTTGATPGTVLYLADAGRHIVRGNIFGKKRDSNEVIPGYVYHVYAAAGSVNITENEFRHFYRAIYAGTTCSVVNNRFYQRSTSDPLFSSTSVMHDAATPLKVIGNELSQISGGSDGGDTMSFLYSTDTTYAPVVANNTATMESSAAAIIFVNLVTSGNTPRLVAAGNRVTLTTTGTANASFTKVSTTSVDEDISISGNTVYASNPGSGITTLVDISGAVTADNTLGILVNGNTFSATGSSSGIVNGIDITANNVVIGGNTVCCAGQESGTVRGYGIHAVGHMYTITGNLLRQDGAAHNYAVYYGGATISSNSSPGNISIVGNTITQDGEVVPVYVKSGGYDGISNLVVSNNNISTAHINTGNRITGIHVDGTANLGGVINGVSISGNIIREASSSITAGIRQVIYVAGNSTNVITGLSIFGNVITSTNSSTVSNVASNAIDVDYADQVVVAGNSVSNWAGSGTGRTIINVDNCTNAVVASNVLEPGNSAGAQPSIDINTTTNSSVHGNVAVTSSIDTASATNASTSGSNNLS